MSILLGLHCTEQLTIWLEAPCQLLYSTASRNVSHLSLLQLIFSPQNAPLLGQSRPQLLQCPWVPGLTGKYTLPSKHMSHIVYIWLMEGQPVERSVSQFIFRGLMMSRCGAPGGLWLQATCCCTYAGVSQRQSRRGDVCDAVICFFPPANACSETLSTVPSARHSADNIAVPAGIISGSHKGKEWMERCDVVIQTQRITWTPLPPL